MKRNSRQVSARQGRVDKGVKRGVSFELEIDGETVAAYPGETIATVMICQGINNRKSADSVVPTENPSREYYCGMGVCWECMVSVEAQVSVRACMTSAMPGMKVWTIKTNT